MIQATPPARSAHLPQLGAWGTVIRWFRVYGDLFFIRWANIRNEWYFHVILGPVFPLAMLAFLKMLGAAQTPESALYVTAGNAVLALVLGPMQSIANDLAWGRQRNDLDYLATLPMSKLQMVLAFVSVSTVFTMPAMLLTMYVGGLWLGFAVRISAAVIPVMLLSGLSMCGLGVMYGVYARNGHHANIMNTLTTGVVMFLSPVLIPYENLPRLLQISSRLLPTSYAASAFRAAVAGATMRDIWIDCAVLAVFAVSLLYMATRKLDWRVEH